MYVVHDDFLSIRVRVFFSHFFLSNFLSFCLLIQLYAILPHRQEYILALNVNINSGGCVWHGVAQPSK